MNGVQSTISIRVQYHNYYNYVYPIQFYWLYNNSVNLKRLVLLLILICDAGKVELVVERTYLKCIRVNEL